MAVAIFLGPEHEIRIMLEQVHFWVSLLFYLPLVQHEHEAACSSL